MRPAFLILLYIIAVLLPLLLAWSSGAPPRSFPDELASGLGLMAFAIILVEFVLSGRFRSISGRIGMDKTMRVHQLLARTALAFALLHPFLYTSPFKTPLPWDTTRQLTLTGDIAALSSGLIGWILLPGFVILSIARDRLPYKYETWRLMHGLGAIMIAGFLLHHTLGAGRYSQNDALAGFWLLLVFGAVASLIYVYVLKPISLRTRPWVVSSVKSVAPRIWAVSLSPEGHPGLDYEAGQFAWLNIGHSSFSLYENPFSIASAPAAGKTVEFIIKEFGDTTSRIGKTEIGTRAYLDAPFGNLVVSRHDAPGIALVAGGVGIAPLLGILRQLHLEKDPRPTVLIDCNQSEEQIVYREELDTLSKEHGTKLIHVLAEPSADWRGRSGLLDATMISQIFDRPELKEWLYILCGPPALMNVAEQALIELGVPADRILSERFKYD